MKKHYPLSYSQKVIWNVEKYAPNTSINNIIGTLYFNEKLNFNLLEKAINLLLKKKIQFEAVFKL